MHIVQDHEVAAANENQRQLPDDHLFRARFGLLVVLTTLALFWGIFAPWAYHQAQPALVGFLAQMTNHSSSAQ